MNELDLLKYCSRNNLYDSYQYSQLNLDYYGLGHTIGFLGQAPNLKRTAYDLYKEQSNLINNGISNSFFGNGLFLSDKTTEEETLLALKSWCWKPEDSDHPIKLNFNGTKKYMMGIIYCDQKAHVENGPDYYPGLNGFEYDYMSISITETPDYHWGCDEGNAYIDSVHYKDQGMNYNITYPTFKNSLTEYKTICLENMNFIRKIPSPWINPTDSPIQIYNDIYDIYYAMDDPDAITYTDIYNTLYYYFFDLIKNTMSFAVVVNNQLLSDEFIIGLTNYPAPINLNQSELRCGISREQSRSYYYKEWNFYFDYIPATLDPENELDAKILNWLKLITI